MILLADCWGLVSLVALVVSRMLNIWSIKQRARPDSPAPESGHASPDRVRNRPRQRPPRRPPRPQVRPAGQAVTTQTWLRSKTALDGYLEAASKLLVYGGGLQRQPEPGRRDGAHGAAAG
ncbi:Uncharacterized protein TCAP_00014 [Tolypocladium capitatum]|uniref:Uncharacterized protein n=1 Tax=Tolypocladium capitatum TaxID=45235 RepID=A0A2K3QRD4_9HYPO|nr:Uncharacterized protein TCAP_00014 [Tolypocladium capitatum]